MMETSIIHSEKLVARVSTLYLNSKVLSSYSNYSYNKDSLLTHYFYAIFLCNISQLAHGKESSILLSPTPVVTAEHVSSGGAEILSSPDTPSKPSLSVAPDIQPRSKCTTSNIVSFAEAPTMPEKTQRSTESNYPESNSSLKAFKASASNQSQKSGTSGLENDNFSTTVSYSFDYCNFSTRGFSHLQHALML